MGSSCSILNDTENDVWITHGVNWKILIPAVTGAAVGIGAIATAGVGLVAIAAAPAAVAGAAGVEAAVAGGGVIIMGTEGVIMGVAAPALLGLTAGQWAVAATVTGVVTTLAPAALGTALGITEQQAEKLQRYVIDFQERSTLIKPGEKYTWTGTLSLNKRVYVMNDKLQIDDRGCFTGALNGSENVYTISEHFRKLDIKKENPK